MNTESVNQRLNESPTMSLTPKAALKTRALQTLRAEAERQVLAAAFGVRASLAPLFIRRCIKVRFRVQFANSFGDSLPSDGRALG